MESVGADKSTPLTLTGGSKHPLSPQLGVFAGQRIDWIEGTFKGRTPINLPTILTQNYVECRPHRAYTIGSRYADGRILSQNPGRTEMGAHITWSGDACGRCPMDTHELVQHLYESGFSFTRLDLAIDFINCNLDPVRATEEIENGRCKTRAKDKPFWGNAGQPGYTQYVGKKASEIYLRIYDKAAEMGAQQDHTRVELVVRQKRADQAAWRLVHHTDFRAMVLAYATFPSWREWGEAMAVYPVKLPAERKETNTQRWLLEQCAPALARVMHLYPEQNFDEKFMEAVKISYEQMSNT